MSFRPLSFLAIVLTCGLPGVGRADAPRVLDVWPGKAPGVTGQPSPGKIKEQKHGGGTIQIVSDVSQPTLTVYRPAKEKDTGAAVLICPGGGYNILALDLEGQEVAAWLNSLGVTGIVLKYRVPRRKDQPPHQAPLQDAQRAMGLVRSRAREWGIDPQRLGILGFSAGGHLAAAASTNFDKRTYELLDEVDRVSCRPDFTVLIYPAYLTGKDGLAPEIRVTAQTPPTFLAHAANDPIGPENSIALFGALRKAGVPAELHIYESGGHGFGLRRSKHPCSTWPQRCADWLRSRGHLEKKAP
jgi:acetyl esterase/lipase